MDGYEAQAPNLPRRKLLFSLGQKKINKNLMQGAFAFNEADSALGLVDADAQKLKSDQQRVKKSRKKATARLAHAEDEYVHSNAGPADHSVSQNLELLRSSTTVLEMSDINQGVQYDQRGRGIKSTQSGPSRHATSSKVAWPIAGSLLAARRCHEATGNFFIEGSSYESVNNNFANIAPSDIQYQIQSRDAMESLNEENVAAGAHDIDQESRTIFCSEQQPRSFHAERVSQMTATGQKKKERKKANPKNIYDSQIGGEGCFESRSAQEAQSSSIVLTSADMARARKINGGRAANNLNRMITRGFQESYSLEPDGRRDPSQRIKAIISPRRQMNDSE